MFRNYLHRYNLSKKNLLKRIKSNFCKKNILETNICLGQYKQFISSYCFQKMPRYRKLHLQSKHFLRNDTGFQLRIRCYKALYSLFIRSKQYEKIIMQRLKLLLFMRTPVRYQSYSPYHTKHLQKIIKWNKSFIQDLRKPCNVQLKLLKLKGLLTLKKLKSIKVLELDAPSNHNVQFLIDRWSQKFIPIFVNSIFKKKRCNLGILKLTCGRNEMIFQLLLKLGECLIQKKANHIGICVKFVVTSLNNLNDYEKDYRTIDGYEKFCIERQIRGISVDYQGALIRFLFQHSPADFSQLEYLKALKGQFLPEQFIQFSNLQHFQVDSDLSVDTLSNFGNMKELRVLKVGICFHPTEKGAWKSFEGLQNLTKLKVIEIKTYFNCIRAMNMMQDLAFNVHSNIEQIKFIFQNECGKYFDFIFYPDITKILRNLSRKQNLLQFEFQGYSMNCDILTLEEQLDFSRPKISSLCVSFQTFQGYLRLLMLVDASSLKEILLDEKSAQITQIQNLTDLELFFQVLSNFPKLQTLELRLNLQVEGVFNKNMINKLIEQNCKVFSIFVKLYKTGKVYYAFRR